MFGGAPGGGMFAGLDAKTRYDMVKQLLGGAMQSAQGSNSPLLAALAPIAGAFIGGKAAAQYAPARAQEDADRSAMLGLSPDMAPLIDVLNDPNTPDGMRSVAMLRIREAMKAPKGKGGGRRSSGGGTGAPGQPRLYNPYTGPDGKRYGTTRDGRVLPYQMPEGGYGGAVSEDDPLGIMGADDDPLALF